MLEETGLTPLRLEDAGHTYTFPLAEKWRDLYEPDVTTIREHVFFAEVAPAFQPVLDPRADARRLGARPPLAGAHATGAAAGVRGQGAGEGRPYLGCITWPSQLSGF